MKKRVFMAAVVCSVLLSACGTGKQEAQVTLDESTLGSAEEAATPDTNDTDVPEEVPEADSDEVKNDDLYYSYNPHVFPQKLGDAYSKEEVEAFLNLCDALRAGEDSFKCANRDVYEWCFSGGPLDDLFPVARFTITPDFADGYYDGSGHFTYDIPVEEFLQKQAGFEKMVEDILRENVDKTYTDFEKCIALYEYMVDNYTYDWEEFSNNDLEKMFDIPRGTYGTYRTFRDKTGICDDLSSVYCYLLLQCDVEAMKYEGLCGDSHAWSYVTIDGTGYFVDPTWGLNENGTPDLTFFMMTEEDRRADFGDDMYPIMYYYDHKNQNVDFSAKDDRYSELHGGEFLSLDRENKILHYSVDGEEREFHYSA